MRRLTLIALLLSAGFLAVYGISQLFNLPLLQQPGLFLGRGGWFAAGLSTALLVLDVLLPVPSSLVMLGNGALFGLLLGSLLSLVGSVLSALLAWWIGRGGAGRLERWMGRQEHERARAWLARNGLFAVAASRPVPILAETVALLAGANRMPAAAVIGASALGILPAVLLYAWAGSAARDPLEAGILFGVTLVLAGLLWLVGRRLS